MKILPLQSSEYLSKPLVSALRGEIIPIERSQFLNSEKYLRIENSGTLAGQDVMVVGSIANVYY